MLAICVWIMGLSVSAQLENQLQNIFSNFNMMGMSVWVHCQGQSQEYHIGLRDFTRQLPMNEDSKYRIASISKAVTALGLMKLYDQGLFQLDEDISDYLGYEVRNPNHPNVPITFRMLLSHTSSLQDGGGYNGFLSATLNQNPIPNISQLIVPGGSNYTSNMWRLETPGTYFAYSNVSSGVVGTLIEKISNQRFDLYMQEHILGPLGITGSYNVSLLPEIDDVAVLYRNQGGWTPQVDNYQGVAPVMPDLSGYLPGTNGLRWGPQGGLRASAGELGKFLRFFMTNGSSVPDFISSSTLDAMRTVEWNWTGNNGDNYYGLFKRWGLGLHHANTSNTDFICLNQGFGTFIGHTGEAYGLVSEAYFNESNEVAFVFMHNGLWGGHVPSASSGWYTIEESIFNAICAYWPNCGNAVNEISEESGWVVFPNPSHSDVLRAVFTPGIEVTGVYEMTDMTGRRLTGNRFSGHSIEIDISVLSSGQYFLKIIVNEKQSTRKFIKF
jgi:CubicO group peptidase (beta-lactamase class C family)